MALFPDGTAKGASSIEKPLGSETQVETLPELNVAAGEDQTAWNARTRTITFITPAGVKQTTAALAFNATPATIQTAVQGLAGVGAGNVIVSGAGRKLTYAFSGTLANKAFRRMYNTYAGTKHFFETIIRGASLDAQKRIKQGITSDAIQSVAGGGDFEGFNVDIPTDIGQAARYVAPNQIVTETFIPTGAGAPSGTRTLTFKGKTTTAIAWNATPATIQTALNALEEGVGVPLFTANSIVVSEVNGVYFYTFGGSLTGPQERLKSNSASLVNIRSSMIVRQQGSTIPNIVEAV